MGSTRIGDAADVVNIGEPAVLDVVLSHYLAVACTHYLNVYALIYGIGIAVVGPEEGAYLHLGRITCTEHLAAVGGELDYLACLELLIGIVAQLLECKGLGRKTEAVAALAYDYRKSAEFVSCSDNAVLCKDNEGHSALYLALSVAYAVNEGVALSDESSDEIAGIYLSAAHSLEVCAALFEELVHELFSVADNAD